MSVASIVNGLARRVLRAVLRQECRRGRAGRGPGRTRLWGYGLDMRYPDRRIWLYQFLDIFAADGYGAWGLPPRARVIDGGANVGTFVLFVRWRVPDARIVAVEPASSNMAYLEQNVRAAGAASVELRRAALGRAPGKARIGGADSDALRVGGAGGEDVDVIPLADLLTEHTDLLKLDIEGSEKAALEGAGPGLRNVDRVVIEVHDYDGRPSEFADIVRLLAEGGLDRFAVRGHQEYARGAADTPVHCCLLEAWRSSVTRPRPKPRGEPAATGGAAA